MREILFRGKRKDNSEWVYGCLLIDESKDDERKYKIQPKLDVQLFAYPVIPETIGQYTGLQDKNGVKIFEGDVVQEDDVIHEKEIQAKGNIGIVKFVKGCWIVEFNNLWDFLQTNCSTITIIGNIHDNPELLK